MRNQIWCLLVITAIAGCGESAAPQSGSAANRGGFGEPPTLPAPLPATTPTTKVGMLEKGASPTTEPTLVPPPIVKFGGTPARAAQTAAAHLAAADTAPASPASEPPLSAAAEVDALRKQNANAPPDKGPGEVAKSLSRVDADVRKAQSRKSAWEYLDHLAGARQGFQNRLDLIMFRKNLDLYKAEHNNKGPKTNEEMMRIMKNDWLLTLPDPPDGQKYVYDPEKEDLYLENE